jgi:hypothetical protein
MFHLPLNDSCLRSGQFPNTVETTAVEVWHNVKCIQKFDVMNSNNRPQTQVQIKIRVYLRKSGGLDK